MRLQGFSKRELKSYIAKFRRINDALYHAVEKSTFDKIVGKNSIQKLEQLESNL